jgi:hypothetical protein
MRPAPRSSVALIEILVGAIVGNVPLIAGEVREGTSPSIGVEERGRYSNLLDVLRRLLMLG